MFFDFIETSEYQHFELINESCRICTYIKLNFEISLLSFILSCILILFNSFLESLHFESINELCTLE